MTKNSSLHLIRTIGIALPLVCGALTVQGANVFTAIDGDFSDTANWSLGELPGDSDQATQGNSIIQAGNIANLTVGHTAANPVSFIVRDNIGDGPHSMLNMSADLLGLANFWVGLNDGHYGIVSQTAGTLGANSVVVGDGNGTAPAASVYDVSGGQVDSANTTVRWNSDLNVKAGTLNATGTIAVENGGRFNLSDGTVNTPWFIVRNSGGTVNHAGGTLDTDLITVNAGAYHQCGGLVDNAGPLSIEGGATYNLTGGTYDGTEAGANTLVQGAGTLAISGGLFSATGTGPTDVVRIDGVTVNISGGTFDLGGGQIYPIGGPTINVTGDAASIRMDRLNMGNSGLAGTFNLTLGAAGISPVRSFAWMSLIEATVNVDGSAYAGPVGEIDLFTAANLTSTPTVTPVVTGFVGYDAAVNVRTLMLAEVTDIQCVADSAGSLNGTYFDVTGGGGTHRFWYDVDGGGTAPADPGAGVHEIDLTAGATADAVAAATQAVIDAQGDFGAAVNADFVTVTDAAVGQRDDAVDSGATGFTFTIVTNGTILDQALYLLLTPNINDNDGDGLSNFDEVAVHGTDPGVDDSDGDGVNDGDEVTAGSDPLTDDSAIIALVLDSLNSLNAIAVGTLTPSGPDFLLTLSMEESADLETFSDLDLTAVNPVVDEVADTITFTIDGSAMKKFLRLEAE
ncbi:MAG: hypothetical protein HKN82_08920 [Akkermansiaceae bacterium]|nr:hypothetical protein [Akkermansiaceae bacterium]